MRRVLGIAGAVAIGLASGAAMAADPVIAMAPVVPATAPEAMDDGFDWGRAYMGIQGGAWVAFPGVDYQYTRANAVIGRNLAVGDRMVLGVELQPGIYFPPLQWEIYATVRAGFLIGTRGLLYGIAGVGFDNIGAGIDGAWLAGAGLEIAVGDQLALRVEGVHYQYFGDPAVYASLTAGLTWYARRR